MRKTRLKCFARGFVPLRTSATKNKNYPSTSLSGAEATARQHSSMGCLQPSDQGFRFPPVDEKRCRLPWEVGEKFSPFLGHIHPPGWCNFCWQKTIRCSVAKPPKRRTNQPLSWANSLKNILLVFQSFNNIMISAIPLTILSLITSFAGLYRYIITKFTNLKLKRNVSEDQKIEAKPMESSWNLYFEGHGIHTKKVRLMLKIHASFHSTSAWHKRKSAGTTFSNW